MFNEEYLIKNTKHIVEANSFESTCLWEKYNKKHAWKSINFGKVVTLGEGTRKTTVSIFWTMINCEWVIFYEATSQLVDHVLIDKYFEENYLVVSKNNAQNFHCTITAINKNVNAILHKLNINKEDFIKVSLQNPDLDTNGIIKLVKFNF